MSQSPSSLKPNFYQILGYCPPGDELSQEDIISAIQFEKRGDYLAVGDRGGRVVIFEKDYRGIIEPSYPQNFLEGLDSTPAQGPEFRYKSEFQSHEPEIHSFIDTEVADTIKKVRWCVAENGLPLLLSADKKTIKLWKIEERKTEKSQQVVPHRPHRFFSSRNAIMSFKSCMSGRTTLIKNLSWEDPFQEIKHVDDEGGSFWNKSLIEGTGNTFHAKCKNVYAPEGHINSISKNSDAETFISADSLTITSWNLEESDRSFKIVDLRPPETEPYPLEIITTAEFHPLDCNLLAYGCSRGSIHVIDSRQEARHDHSVRIFVDQSLVHHKSVFDLMASGISDVKFLVGKQQIISRDYLRMKLWDMRNDSLPVETFRIQEHLRPKLSDVYFEEHIFDSFECCCSRDGLSFASGSCSNCLKIFSTTNASVEDIKMGIIGNIDCYKISTLPEGTVRRSSLISKTTKRGFEQDGGELDCDFYSPLLHVAWHPTSNLVAASVKSSLILYHT